MSEGYSRDVSHRKKKKKSHSSTEHAKALDKERVHEKSDEVDVEVKGTPPLGNGEGTGGRKLTEAERRFEETQRQRVSPA